jgi:hypothetical protein
VAVFTLEAVLKLFAFGVTIYFVEAWNRFDLTVVRPTWPRRTVILFHNTVLPAPSKPLSLYRVEFLIVATRSSCPLWACL